MQDVEMRWDDNEGADPLRDIASAMAMQRRGPRGPQGKLPLWLPRWFADLYGAAMIRLGGILEMSDGRPYVPPTPSDAKLEKILKGFGPDAHGFIERRRFIIPGVARRSAE